MTTPSHPLSAGAQRRRAYWLKTLHEWHWISSALCLMGMLLFVITGVTLNHAGQIEARPQVRSLLASLPEPLRATLEAQAARTLQAAQAENIRAPLPPALQQWARTQWDLDAAERDAEWSAQELYLALPRPGGDAWLRLDLASGEAEYEHTDRGWISYLNDLHKGRHTGVAWRWFIDIFAAVCLVFTLSGLFMLQMHAGRRSFTWPVVGLGLLIPMLLALLLVH